MKPPPKKRKTTRVRRVIFQRKTKNVHLVPLLLSKEKVGAHPHYTRRRMQMQIRPLPLLIVGALTTALISGHQQQTISEAKATIAAGEALLMASNNGNRQTASVNAYQADLPTTDPTYTTDMDVSWHPWHPEGKAAGVIPVALLDAAKEGGISPVYAAAVFIHETGWGSSSAWVEKNNPAGIKCGDTYCAYDTAAEGLQRMVAIMVDYYSNGRQTVAQQRSMWAETDDAQSIVDLMNQIREGDN